MGRVKKLWCEKTMDFGVDDGDAGRLRQGKVGAGGDAAGAMYCAPVARWTWLGIIHDASGILDYAQCVINWAMVVRCKIITLYEFCIDSKSRN